jgi:hypothetical protein
VRSPYLASFWTISGLEKRRVSLGSEALQVGREMQVSEVSDGEKKNFHAMISTASIVAQRGIPRNHT